MKRVILSLAVLFTVFTASAQYDIQNDQVEKFHSLSITGNINAEVVRGSRNSIEVKLNDADAGKFKWSVDKGVLNISIRPTLGRKSNAEVRIVQADTLVNITIDGSELILNDNPETTILKVSVRGGGKVTAGVRAADMEIDVSGNSVAQFSGMARYLTLRATERSRVDTRQMECTSVEANSNMGAEAYVNVKERLIAETRTGGSIFYMGNPYILRGRSSFKTSSNVLSIGTVAPL